jgi:hypothetical protein
MCFTYLIGVRVGCKASMCQVGRKGIRAPAGIEMSRIVCIVRHVKKKRSSFLSLENYKSSKVGGLHEPLEPIF